MDLSSFDFISESEEINIRPENNGSLSHKTSSLENLISQNEDLMARLKVTLRRLSILENDNQRLMSENNRASVTKNAVSDQILIYKEKDRVWKNKYDQSEKEKIQLLEKLQINEEQKTVLRNECLRYTKYHEKIKSQVKPYIQQLKEYSKTISRENTVLQEKLSEKEAISTHLSHQINSISKNARDQIAHTDKKLSDMIDFYENQMKILNDNIQTLKSKEEELETSTIKLNKSLEKIDIIENENILLKRQKEELKKSSTQELLEMRNRISELTRHNQKLGIEHADLQLKTLEDHKELTLLRQQNLQSTEQMNSLRYMWTSKCEETEKLKQSLEALERLNLELSKKISEVTQLQP